jgi:hypothetical protein
LNAFFLLSNLASDFVFLEVVEFVVVVVIAGGGGLGLVVELLVVEP